MAGAIGETLMHPVDTVKTRIQSAHVGINFQRQNDIGRAVKAIWTVDGIRGFYRGVVPSFLGSMVTGATYFGFIESTKDWLECSRPSLTGPWAHFLAGALGESLGSVVYVPCEVIKQRMQLQGNKACSSAVANINVSSKSRHARYQYYTGVFQAGRCIFHQEGLAGLYSGYFSTLARDVPFAGLQIVLYEGLREALHYSQGRYRSRALNHEFSSLEELLMGGVAGGTSAFFTTPLDVIKTRLQIQGSSQRYKGWFDATRTITREEGINGFFRGVVPRVMWFVPASAFTFMTLEWLRKQFKEKIEAPAQGATQNVFSTGPGSSHVDNTTFISNPSYESR